VRTARTPFNADALEELIFTIRAWGTELRTIFAQSKPSNGKSAAYLVCPVTLP
jgi:hypothetical protein